MWRLGQNRTGRVFCVLCGPHCTPLSVISIRKRWPNESGRDCSSSGRTHHTPHTNKGPWITVGSTNSKVHSFVRQPPLTETYTLLSLKTFYIPPCVLDVHVTSNDRRWFTMFTRCPLSTLWFSSTVCLFSILTLGLPERPSNILRRREDVTFSSVSTRRLCLKLLISKFRGHYEFGWV